MVWGSSPPPTAIKVTLHDHREQESRRVVLPKGPTTRFHELLRLLDSLFAKPIEPKIAYTDRDGDAITVSTDDELRDALAMGIHHIDVRIATPTDRSRSSSWEVVEANRDDGSAKQAVMAAQWSNSLRFWVNGEEVVVENPSPTVRLLDWLRETRGLTGTHVGCHEGGCGICTVSLARMDAQTGKVEVVPINSCLRRLCAVDGCHVITTEGIGCKNSGFHPVQSAIASGNGSQCGFCTPGWVMSMYSLLEKNRSPSAEEVEQHFDGNLCRCTGYRPILTALGSFAAGGARCGQHTSLRHPGGMLSHQARPLRFVDEAVQEEWYRPATLQQYLELLEQAKGKKIRPICASTADGLTKYYSDAPEADETGAVFVDITLLPELHGSSSGPAGVTCGATLPIAKVIDLLEAEGKETPGFAVLAEHMKRIASSQIRSVASWAGNLMFTREHRSFVSDMATILASAGAKFSVLGADGRKATMSTMDLLEMDGFFLVLSMTIPRPATGAIFETFKVSQRHVFAHAIVNFGACFGLGTERRVQEARIFLGGVCKTLTQASATQAAILGKKLDDATFQAACAALRQDVATNVPEETRQSGEYRLQLATSFLYKTFLSANPQLASPLRSALEPFIPADARPISTGTESYGTVPSEGPVHEYVVKRSAFIQASGEAVYPSDYGGKSALYGQLVFSTAANAKLVALDPSKALKMPGVRDFVTASSIPGLNSLAGNSDDPETLKEKLFFEVNDVVPCVGAVLGCIVATSSQQARLAAKQVVQQYSNQGHVVATMDDALKLQALAAGPPADKRSNFGRRGARGEHAHGVSFAAPRAAAASEGGLLSAKGTFTTGGQKHFYMETQSVCAIPLDGNCWEVIASDQFSDFTQTNLGNILNVPFHCINVKVPRAGGGFGGKLSRQMMTCGAAVVAANKLRCPVRIQNERSDDMQMVGGREPMRFDYEATFDKTGRVRTMDLGITTDGGWFYGDAAGDTAMAVGWSDNCYHYEKFKVTPKAVVTHTPHCTSMRAPGCMQSILAAEVVMERIAKEVGKTTEEVQELNFYKMSDNPVTPFGDHLGKKGYNWTIPTLWTQIQEQCKFSSRKESVAAYNAQNKWTKKGIAISPVKYVMGIDGYASGALICIYGDGSVLVSTGGSELGQGLNTKVALCVAETLGAPLEKVTVGPRETRAVPNNTPTGGSGTSEVSSQAAIEAALQLAPRLKKYLEGQAWEKAITAAIQDNVSLMASAWYKYEKPAGDESTNVYATYGTAVSEVTIDVLTGEVLVDRVDVLMDLGTQLDAAVDLGQLQGGFVIALGYLLSEEVKVDTAGKLLNLGTWEYKIPSAYDIPLEFNVSLLKDSPNPDGIKGSKASAEPAMCLIPSVYLAVKAAIAAAREEAGLGSGWFPLDAPLTPEVIRSAVGVSDRLLVVP